MTSLCARPQRGISLIEAVVALAVMAFGMLGVLGLQSTLRQNADIAKQRSEAVRIAQEAVERRRSFSVLTTEAGKTAFNDIVSAAAVTVAGTNATYSRTETVVDAANPRRKTLVVDVAWTDRAGQAQSVRMSTVIAASGPELTAALSVPNAGSPVQLPGQRHPGIPPAAVNEGESSRFHPPGAPSGYSWVFNNVTGVITQICTASDTCTESLALLLTGFVRFSTGFSQPTPAMAESPSSTAMTVDVVVNATFPSTTSVNCYEEFSSTFIEYFCAVPITVSNPRWSGRSVLAGLTLAGSISDDHDDRFRVCRYTTTRAHTTVPPLQNVEHPLNYSLVDAPLLNQNFLVIRAGDDSNAFDCPADDGSTANVNGNTWHHQPSS